jgi:hypothetical protein
MSAMVKNPADAAAVMPDTSANVATGGNALPPLTTNMTASSLTSGGNSCLDEQIERLKRCEYLREGEVKALCLRAREILVDESNVQRVDAPVTVGTRSAVAVVLVLEYRSKRYFCYEVFCFSLVWFCFHRLFRYSCLTDMR